jgi:DNA-binding FadR family transcriptional regulator
MATRADTSIPADRGAAPSVEVPRLTVTRAYEQLADLLRDQILSGSLREEQRLPSETQLAEQCGVSRSTVREAFRMLQEAGLIERASPRVMVVRRRTEDPAYRELQHALRRRNPTFHHLHEALLALEPELARLAAMRADRNDLEELHQLLDAQEAALDDPETWSQLDDEFHLVIAEMSQNPALVIARAPISQLLVPTLRGFMRSGPLTTLATRYHHRIVGEIEAHDPDTAAAVMRRHVNDFRTAWEKAGLDYHLELSQVGKGPSQNGRM